MVYQCMVYISQYLPKLAENMNVPRIWHLDEEDDEDWER